MTRPRQCPSCGAGFKMTPFNRNGWFYAECGRRWHAQYDWESECARPTGCLRRELQNVRIENTVLRRAATIPEE